MKSGIIKKRYAVLGALVLTGIAAQAVVVNFTAGEGYTNGVLNGQQSWVTSADVPVDSNAGTVGGHVVSNRTGMGYVIGIYGSDGVDVAIYDKYQTSIDFTFGEGYNDNFVTNGLGPADDGYYDPAQGFKTATQGKPIINASLYGGSTNGAENIEAGLVRNGGTGYKFRMYETSWEDFGWDGTSAKPWPPTYESGAVASDLVGISVGDGDYISDMLRITLTVTRGANVNDWAIKAQLFNLDSEAPDVALIEASWIGVTHTNLYDATQMFGGFGNGQSDSNGLMHNRTIHKLTFEAFKAPENFVLWGGTDIINGSDTNINLSPEVTRWRMPLRGFNNKTYVAGTESSPTNSAYYPNRAGRSPNFNFTLNWNWGDMEVRDVDEWNPGDNVDYISVNHGGNSAAHSTNFEAMVVWEEFLTDPSKLESLGAGIRTSDIYVSDHSIFRFIFQGADGEWYASEEQVVPDRTGSDWDAFGDYTIGNVAAATWYEFSPLVNGTATVGVATSAVLDDIQAVGIWLKRTGPEAQFGYGFDINSFSVRGRSGSLYQDWSDAYALIGGQNADEDGDDLNNYSEWVFGGNPTNAADVGTRPVLDVKTGNYAYELVGDEKVTVHIQTRDDLIIGDWESIYTNTVSFDDGIMHAYTNNVGTEAAKKFIRISVD
ncbi:hypothetical protein [Pontiella agarivorans]|uniref:Uncharacterized protein n=1 Tax=Pontiella agarivorans TaxID=3038953 RepID=A0ABU5MYP4_9BACT|nr:hypothetical protein [Pontiella agarivorans]MDZ8119294.1 hypothetical protein [Pontiella agarivorans]